MLPVRQKSWLPESLRDEPLRAQDMAGIRGARKLDVSEIPMANATVSPAPAENAYAYTRTITQRNMFRIPIH